MKHIKLFENNVDEYIISIIWKEGAIDAYAIYDNMENAKLDMLNYINDIDENFTFEDEYKDYVIIEDNDWFFIDADKAIDWLLHCNQSYDLLIDQVDLTTRVEIPERIKMYLDAKKYNL